jgi:class 3 adenylate cyclase/tetratricopeptide (TPR) repeat protein
MDCPQCATTNKSGRRFCSACGHALEALCSQCGARNDADDRFCGNCGQALAASLPAPTAPAAPRAYTPKHLADRILTTRAALEGERKQVTVLFCDVADSMRLTERLDPEVMHELMDRALRLVAEAVHRYEGTVNQYLGDGVMALFGAPVALEDHALRAVQAALAIQETIAGYSAELKRQRGVEIRLRVGLNTGTVVVGKIGDDLRMDYTAVGDTTNLAARVQSLAEPGTVLITGATHHLVEGFVRSQPLGRKPIKGLTDSVELHRVTGRRRRTRLEVSAERGLSRLVGRERDLSLLRDCFRRVRDGRGQIVGVVGEPGVGKSRLLHEFRKSLEGERITWRAGHCLAYGQATPYLPVLEILRANFEVEDGDNALQIEEKLRQGLRRLDPTLEGTLPFLRALFLLPTDDEVKQLDAKLKRQRTFEAIRALTMAGSQRAPLVLVVEDLHWIDATSADYLAFLAESLAGLRVLVLTTYRPGHTVRWADKTYYTQIALDVLDDAATGAIMQSMLDVSELPVDLVKLINAKAEGNPLFVEEVTRSLMEHGALVRAGGGVRWMREATIEFPERAQDIIRARIDRLDEPVKRTAQTAAVIGREFGLRLLAQVSKDGGMIQELLDALKRAELIYETRFFPELEYIFKHAIIQEVAYQSILGRRRRELHGAIGRAVEALYADHLAERLEVLAYHFARSEDRQRAAEYLIRAGDKAWAAFAGREALGFYRQALDRIESGEERRRAEVLYKISSVEMLLGDLDAGVGDAEEALALYEKFGDAPALLDLNLAVMRAYTSGAWDGAKEDKALRHLEAAASLSANDPDSVDKGLIHQRTGHFYLHRGQPRTAFEWASRAQDIFTRLGVPMGTSLGTAVTYTGRPDEGIAYNERNWEPVVKGGNNLVIGVLGHELITTLALLRDVPRARACAERVLSALPANYDTGMGMAKRPFALALTLAGEVSAAEAMTDDIWRLEHGTFYGCIFEDGLAVAFHHLRRGNFQRVREYVDWVTPVFRDRNLVAALSGCSLVSGQLALAESRLHEAEVFLTEARKVCRDGGNVLFELWVLPVLGETHLRAGQRDRADECVSRGFELLTSDQDWRGLPAPLQLVRGMVAGAHRRWDEAERCFETALAINRRYELPWDEAKTLFEWALLNRERGGQTDRELARQRFSMALEMFQRVGAAWEVQAVRAALGASV